MIKKLLLTTAALTVSIATMIAGTVNLAWSPYTSDPTVNLIKIYAVQGTNTTFTTGNANATVINSTSVTNNSFTITNLPSGAWTFTATASSTNGIESVDSNVVWTNIYPGAVMNLMF